jgi:ankyrin repeat protein
VDVHAAARLGLLDRLHELVAADPALVHARGGDGQTPLHFTGTIGVAGFLLEHGADIDARDLDHESTPAQHMIRDRQETARYLVQRGCATDLFMAAALGDSGLARGLLDADPDRIRLRVSDECFPRNNPRSGGTIYQWALGWQVSPHDVARQFGHADLLRLLLDRSPPEVRLLDACWTADEPAMASILAKHEGLVRRLSATMLRQVAHAARNNHTAAVRSMLSVGMPVDALGQHRATALHWAAFHGNAEMTREILRHQPPLEFKDADFQATPLGWAIHGSVHGWHCGTGDYPATVALLLGAGARRPDRPAGGTEAVRAALRRAENHRSP